MLPLKKNIQINFNLYLKKLEKEAGEMAQQLHALAALPEDLSPIPTTHMATHNCPHSSSRIQLLFLASTSTRHTYSTHTYAQTKYPYA